MTDSRCAPREFWLYEPKLKNNPKHLPYVKEALGIYKDIPPEPSNPWLRDPAIKLIEKLPQSSDRKAEIEAAAFNACFSGKGASEEKRSWTWEIFWDGWKKALAFVDANPADSTRAVSPSSEDNSVTTRMYLTHKKAWKSLFNEQQKQITDKDAEIERLGEEIQALTYEGRSGELEQANVSLADEIQQLKRVLEEYNHEVETIQEMKAQFIAEKAKVTRLREAFRIIIEEPYMDKYDQESSVNMWPAWARNFAHKALSETETGEGES